MLKCSRVDFIGDRYPPVSIKGGEHARRAAAGSQLRRILSEEQELPIQWNSFLNHGKNKEELIEFFFRAWSTMSVDLEGIDLYMAHGESCHLISATSVMSVPELTCDHEEADTRIALHCCHASNTYANIAVKSSDTDVAIILLSLMADIGSDIYFLTGCDSTSAFHGKGKRRPLDLVLKNIEYQEIVEYGESLLIMGPFMSYFGKLCGNEKKKEEERHLRANDRHFNLSQHYANNTIKTSKYNIFNFLPLNLFNQFRRLANAYFLFLLILQLIPYISSLSWFTTAVPLIVVLSVTGTKDAIDDINRHKCDKQVNSRKVKVLIDGQLKTETWKNIQVGDLIKLENNDFVTADLLLLSSSEPLSLVYVETAELDGETNLKVKQSLTVTGELGDNIDSLTAFNGEVRCEPPNNRLDKFKGTLTVNGQTYALDNDKLLLRGCTIRNTEWCFGLVIFAGPDTKVMQNSGNVEMIRLGNSFFIDWDRKMYYAPKDTPALARNTSLNEELGQIKYIFSDKTGTLTQNIMTFNKCSVNGKAYGDLYDFSGQRVEITEKTERVDFSWNQLADPKFIFHDYSLMETVREGNPEAQAFFRLLALCHTVMPEEKKEGELHYQAQSPDEGALVTAARNFGFVFRSRTPETITVVEMGRQVIYELLAVLDFNNLRKRMSVIVRSPEGRITLYCKGADTIIYERLHPSSNKLMEVTTGHLNEYAGDGLRTLVLAYKDLEESCLEDWRQRHHEASITMEGRDEKLDDLYEEIEKDMILLGVTAVEDKLQDGVPQTIEQLTKADIKIWVLTGDKQETAENIGYSCNMLREEMKDVFIVAANTAEGVKEELQNARRKMCPQAAEEPSVVKSRAGLFWIEKTETVKDEKVNGDYGLIINGHSLAFALVTDLRLELLRTACMCQTVICCRVTPLQKAQVVQLVKKYKQAVTLAIGDGANDVSMIKAAHIGVGISGQEGMQAVLSSDFSFAQFRYLQRLLLVHGRWSYLRMCKFLRYFFYKNFTFTFVLFWYSFFCGFSAQSVYDEWFITCYNLIYTALPIIGLGIFDQDVNDRWSFHYPQLYSPGQLNQYFTKTVLVKCMLQSLYSSIVLFFIPWAAMHDTVRNDGKDMADYQSFASLVQTCLLIVVYIQVRRKTQTEGLPAPAPHRPPVRRISTRRSSYAFSHARGYGDLVTSQKFLPKRSPKRPALFTQKPSTIVESQPQYYSTIAEEPEEPQSPREELHRGKNTDTAVYL
ncbi:phospholipid-transporting ATPase FetA-like [Pholidichthys leucotaenia]